MFGTGTRFAEYGITGGFFIVTQIVTLQFIFPDALAYLTASSGDLFANFSGKVPEPLRPALQSLVVALALLSVFIAGLLLDLVGSYFVVHEAGVFREHLTRNRVWVSKLVETTLPDYAGDYARFLILARKYGLTLNLRKSTRALAFWRPAVWREMRRAPGLPSLRKMQKLFRRVEFIFIARVVASGTKTELLVEQLSVCRMARAIAAAIMAVSVEAWIGFLVLGIRTGEPDIHFLWWLAPTVLGTLFGMLISKGAYSRLCLILFSLLYASTQAHKSEDTDGSRPGG
jgi:hypothetical protein